MEVTHEEFRHVLGRFATGLAVVTAVGDDGPQGLTCQAFASVSLEPPLVLFCASKTSRSWPLVRASGSFCANLLAADQVVLADVMATRGAAKFADVVWEAAPATGSPVIAGVLGFVDCGIEAVHDAGDHDIVVGRVLALGSFDDRGEPLVRFAGGYITER